jgi:hypothetical protein
MERPFCFEERALIRELALDSPTDFTGDHEIPLDGFSHRQERVTVNLTGMDCGGGRCTPDGEPPIHPIQPLIPERNSVLGRDGLQASASPISLFPTDFEKVGKIRIH